MFCFVTLIQTVEDLRGACAQTPSPAGHSQREQLVREMQQREENSQRQLREMQQREENSQRQLWETTTGREFAEAVEGNTAKLTKTAQGDAAT